MISFTPGCIRKIWGDSVGAGVPLTLDQVHQGILQPYIEKRRKAGVKSSTIARGLTVVRRILTLASRVWRNDANRPYLAVPPLLNMPA